jgi:hypothetical protein
LMINGPSILRSPEGSTIEVRHERHTIIAEVVWSRGTRAGLRSVHWVPVDDILALSTTLPLQLTAGRWPHVERRKRRREVEQRLRGRAWEFATVVTIGAVLSAGAYSLASEALARPMAAVYMTLGG